MGWWSIDQLIIEIFFAVAKWFDDDHQKSGKNENIAIAFSTEKKWEILAMQIFPISTKNDIAFYGNEMVGFMPMHEILKPL